MAVGTSSPSNPPSMWSCHLPNIGIVIFGYFHQPTTKLLGHPPISVMGAFFLAGAKKYLTWELWPQCCWPRQSHVPVSDEYMILVQTLIILMWRPNGILKGVYDTMMLDIAVYMACCNKCPFLFVYCNNHFFGLILQWLPSCCLHIVTIVYFLPMYSHDLPFIAHILSKLSTSKSTFFSRVL